MELIIVTGLRVGLISPVFPHPKGGVYVGIERHALELTRWLRRAGCSVTVFTTFWNGGMDGDSFETMIIRRAPDISQKVGRYAALFDLHYLSWGRGLMKFRENLSQCDVLHSLAPLSCSRDLTAAGQPLVTHFHHFEAITRPRELLHKPFHYWLENHAYRHSTLVAALSRHSAAALMNAFHIPTGQIRIIPDGVDLTSFSAQSERRSGPPTILCVGSHERRKGHVYLLRALDRLKKEGLGFRLISVGAGPETRGLKALARELGLESRVDFIGYLRPDSVELPKIYGRADLLVHPSLEEGFGMVLVEALASSIPVIATRVGAIPEVVGDAGLLVAPKDPEALAGAIREVLTDANLASTLGRNGRARAEALFGWRSVIKRTLEVYEEAIRQVHRSS